MFRTVIADIIDCCNPSAIAHNLDNRFGNCFEDMLDQMDFLDCVEALRFRIGLPFRNLDRLPEDRDLEQILLVFLVLLVIIVELLEN